MSGMVEDNDFSPGDVHTCPFSLGTFHGSKAQKKNVTRGAFLGCGPSIFLLAGLDLIDMHRLDGLLIISKPYSHITFGIYFF